MKRVVVLLLVFSLILLSGCGKKTDTKSAESQTVTTTNPTFTWGTLTGVDEQALRVFDGNELIAQKRNAESGITYNEIIPNTPLEPGKTYSWQVFGLMNGRIIKSTPKETFTVS